MLLKKKKYPLSEAYNNNGICRPERRTVYESLFIAPVRTGIA